MFECSSRRYFDPRSTTTCGTCDEAALSRYTSGFPFTVCDSTGKSFLTFSTSQLLIVFTAVMVMTPCLRPCRGDGPGFCRLRSGRCCGGLFLFSFDKFAQCFLDHRGPPVLLAGDLVDPFQ